jgi:hypothetical protein
MAEKLFQVSSTFAGESFPTFKSKHVRYIFKRLKNEFFAPKGQFTNKSRHLLCG